MRPDDPMAHSGAIWCDAHGRWECCKNSKRSGERCHGPAIKGIDRCRSHAGVKTEVAKAQGEAITAWSALNGKVAISHTQAVLGMLQMSWLRVHIYAGLLEEQVTAAQAGREETLVDYGGGGDGAGPVGAGVGLVGHTFAAVKDIGIYASGEAVRALVQLEAQERDRCVKYAKTAHDMGIAEQQVKLAEQQGLMLAEAVRRIADSLLVSVMALVARSAQEGDDQAARIAEAIRGAWPAWLGEIVPREFRAIMQGAPL